MERLGKKLKLGETFITSTKRMTKDRSAMSQWNEQMNGPLITYEVLRPGMIRTFMKGKRNYLCEVLALVELRTGYYGITLVSKQPKATVEDYEQQNIRWRHAGAVYTGYNRWWQFNYLVKVIEN